MSLRRGMRFGRTTFRPPTRPVRLGAGIRKSGLQASLNFELLEERALLAAWQFDGVNDAATSTSLGAHLTGPVAAAFDAGSLEAIAEGTGFESPTAAVAPAQIPRGRPTLDADGVTFVGDNGQLLRGPFASTEWGNPPPLSAIQEIKLSGANAIHLYGEVFDPNYATGVPGSGTAPGYAVGRIDQMVQMTRDEGLYLVLTIGNGGNNGSFNYDYVIDFWSFYAPRYANEAHVIYEVQNEPHAWSAPYPQAALTMEADAYALIRSLAPDTPILLFSFAVLGSGPDAVSDINWVSAAASVDWSNAGVAIHGYAGYEATAASAEYILNAGYPVFMTEFAGSDWGDQGTVVDIEMVADLERLGISWLTFQHIPPNFISSSYNDPTAFDDLIDRAGISWSPDYGNWPLPRGVYGNDGQPWSTSGLSGTLRIEAENFDTGGQGVAYNDSDNVNTGVAHRADEGVDLLRSSDGDGTFVVSSTAAGEWLEFTIFVDEPGYYDVDLRYAAASSDGAVRLLFNDEERLDALGLPATGGHTSWSTASGQVFLEFGRQKLRVEILAGDFAWNWIELTPVSSSFLANGAYKLINRNSSLVAEADTANTTVIQNPYTGASNERWNLVHRGAGQYSITSASNGWSWSTFYNGNGDSINLAPWGYDGAADRRFILAPAGGGYFSIIVADGGMSAEIAGASQSLGADVQQYVYFGGSHQQWAILDPAALTPPTGLQAAWGDPNDVPGDYDADRAVTGRDFLAWQRAAGSNVTQGDGADGNGDGAVDAADLAVWSHSFGHQADAAWINLSWNPTEGAAGYSVKRSTTPGGPYTTIAVDVTATSYNDPGLASGETYYYVVSALGNSGESLDSGEASPLTLHAHWMFDEASGAIAADATNNGWDGSLQNGASRTQGVSGNAVNLDGSNDHVNLPAGVVDGLTEATVAGWFYLDSASTWSRLFDFGTSTNNYMFVTPRSSSGNVRFAITTGSGEERINGSSPLATGKWIHVAVTIGNGTGVLYVNGVEQGRNSGMTLTPDSLGPTNANYIGRSQFSWDPYLDGRVDDFRIYPEALTASQIADLAGTLAPLQLAADAGGTAETLALTLGEESSASVEHFPLGITSLSLSQPSSSDDREVAMLGEPDFIDPSPESDQRTAGVEHDPAAAVRGIETYTLNEPPRDTALVELTAVGDGGLRSVRNLLFDAFGAE